MFEEDCEYVDERNRKAEIRSVEFPTANYERKATF